MNLWLGTRQLSGTDKIRVADTSDAKLREKIGKLAVEGWRASPSDEMVSCVGVWQVSRVSFTTDQLGIIALVEKGVDVATTLEEATYVASATGEVRKKRGA